jgi:hypothetical protein
MVNLVTVPGVELMKVGKWRVSTGEFEVTPELISAAIEAHQSGVLRKPVIRLGHNDPRFSGDPSVGFIDNVRASEDGSTLLGDLVGMPEWLGEILPSAYPDRSIEGLYDYTAPDGSEHPFILTGLGLLGVTPPGVSSLKSMQDVQKLYELDLPVAAATAIGEIGGTAVRFTVQAAQTQKVTEKEGGPAMALPEKVAEALGIDADADEATILAKLTEAGLRVAEKTETEVEVGDVKKEEAPALPVAAAAPAVTGLMQIDPTQYAALVAAAQAGQRAEARQISDDDERTVMAAIGQGKIPPARKDHWLGALKADRDGTKQVLASLAAGLIPLKEAGHQGVAGQVGFEGAPSPDQQVIDYAFGNVMARLGVPTKKGVNN